MGLSSAAFGAAFQNITPVATFIVAAAFRSVFCLSKVGGKKVQATPFQPVVVGRAFVRQALTLSFLSVLLQCGGG